MLLKNGHSRVGGIMTREQERKIEMGIASILKHRFPNLSVIETMEIAFSMVAEVYKVLVVENKT